MMEEMTKKVVDGCGKRKVQTPNVQHNEAGTFALLDVKDR